MKVEATLSVNLTSDHLQLPPHAHGSVTYLNDQEKLRAQEEQTVLSEGKVVLSEGDRE